MYYRRDRIEQLSSEENPGAWRINTWCDLFTIPSLAEQVRTVYCGLGSFTFPGGSSILQALCNRPWLVPGAPVFFCNFRWRINRALFWKFLGLLPVWNLQLRWPVEPAKPDPGLSDLPSALVVCCGPWLPVVPGANRNFEISTIRSKDQPAPLIWKFSWLS